LLLTGVEREGERENYCLSLRLSPLLKRFDLVLAVITPFTRLSDIKAAHTVRSLRQTTSEQCEASVEDRRYELRKKIISIQNCSVQ